MDNNNQNNSNNAPYRPLSDPSTINAINMTLCKPNNILSNNLNLNFPPPGPHYNLNQRPGPFNLPLSKADYHRNVPPPPFHNRFTTPRLFSRLTSFSRLPPPFCQPSSSAQSFQNPPFYLPTSHLPMHCPQPHEINALDPGSCLPVRPLTLNQNRYIQSLNAAGKSGPIHPLHESFKSFKKDQKLVDKWIEKKLDNKQRTDQLLNNFDVTKKVPAVTKLSDVHKDIATYRKTLTELKQDGSSDHMKDMLYEIATKISNPSYQEHVKKMVAVRRKKRLRQRKAKKVLKEKFYAQDRLIDKNRQLVINAENNKKKQKLLQQEADSILREVRTKQSDAINFLKILSNIRELREHRLKRGAQQGFVSDELHDNYFQTISGGLQEMVQSQYEDYLLEERTLNVMIDQHQTEGDNRVQSSPHTKSVSTADILRVYFGNESMKEKSLYESYTAADTSSEMLSNRRYLWDKHVSDKGSELPVGWALPLPAGNDWRMWKVNW